MSHVIRILIACVLPILLIFLLLMLGVSEGVTLAVFFVLMLACHLLTMRWAHHGGHGSYDTILKMKGIDDA